MNRDSALPTRRLQPGTSIAHARPWGMQPVTLDSPALDVMTDLTKVKAATIGPSASVRTAEQTMIYQGVRMLFVVSSMPAVEGLITATDLSGDRQMRLVQQRGVHYDELCVADVMTGLAMLDAIDFDHMKTANVGNLVAAMKKHGRNHLLVVEAASGAAPERVRGVISRAQIERQLGTPVNVTEVANSFAEIVQMLA